MKSSEIAYKVAELRNQKGMTQKELAELCNVDVRTIQRIESGEVAPRKHTLRLLSTILEYDLISLNTSHVSNEKIPGKAMKLALIAGLIFSINAIPVVFDLITNSLNTTAHIITVLIHIASCIYFYRGFYLLGKVYQNQVMQISFLIAIVLLPLINIMELLKPYYFNPLITAVIFALLCITVIFCGVGILIEVNKHKDNHLRNYYKIGGLAMLIEGGMFLSTDLNIVWTGLVLSLATNFLLIIILYSAYTSTSSHTPLPSSTPPQHLPGIPTEHSS